MEPTTIAPDLTTVLRAALECAVCMQLLSNPVTLPCGHTFCSSCLLKMTQTSQGGACPFCRSPILSVGSRKPSLVLERIIALAFPDEARRSNQTITGTSKTTPDRILPPSIGLFILGSDVCRGPGMTITLRVFEARYLLLMQTTVANDAVFAICAGRDATHGVLARVIRAQSAWGGEMLVEARIEDRIEFDQVQLAPDSDLGLCVAVAPRLLIDEETTTNSDMEELGTRLDEAVTQLMERDLGAGDRLILERRCGPRPVARSAQNMDVCFWLVAALKWNSWQERDQVLFSTSLRYRIQKCLETIQHMQQTPRRGGGGGGATSLFMDMMDSAVGGAPEGLFDLNAKNVMIFGALVALVVLSGN